MPIVWGGIYPPICPEESIQHTDMICLGEREFPILDLANSLAEGKDITAIPNLWVNKRGEVIKNDLRRLNDLDSLLFPDFTEENKYYIFSHPFNVKMYSIMTSIRMSVQLYLLLQQYLKGNLNRKRELYSEAVD